MADALTTITTLINSPPGQLVVGGVLAGIVWKCFKNVGDALNEKTNRERHKAPATLIRRTHLVRGSRLLPSMFANRSVLPGTSPDRRALSRAQTIR